MKSAAARLVAFLNTARQALTFDLWTLTLPSGTVLRWTDADVDISIFRSRASTGTYWDVDGLLKTAAVDEARFECSGPWTTNLFRQSQNFAASPWGFWVSGTGQYGNVTEDFAAGPEGFATVDRIYLNRGAGNTISDYSTFGQYVPEMRAGKYYSYTIMIAPADPSQVGKQLIFNTNSGYDGIITLTSGWQKFIVNGSFAVYSNQLVYFAVRGTLTANSDIAFLLAYVIDEEGLSTTFYVPTATDPASQASPSAVTTLLIEAADTNIATYSACGSAAAQASGVWNLGTVDETYQAGTAPDGSNDALKLTGNLAVAVPVRNFVATATSVVVKLRIKYVDATSRVFVLRNSTTATNFDALTINLSNGTGSAPGWTVKKLANGWLEITYMRSTGISIGHTLAFYFGYAGASTNTLSHLQWGFELKGADGSYIPTLGSPVTRAADITQQFTRGPIVTRDRVKWVRGIEVDQLRAHLSGPAVLVDGQPLPAFSAAGGFDGAGATLERVYMNDAGVVQGALVWFTGLVADVYPSRMGAELVVKGQLTQLNQQIPRNLYQAQCLNDLYDGNCAAARANFTITGTVASVGSGYNPAVTVNVASTLAARWLELGAFKLTSGANTGISRTVQAQPGAGTSVVLQFSRPFPFAIAPGNTFSATAGCDKLVGTCQAKFNNLGRFRGMPYVPVPETVT